MLLPYPLSHLLLRLRGLSLAMLCLLVAACGPEKPAEPPKATLTINDWFDLKYEEELQQSPVSMAFQGRKDRNNEIDAFTHEAFLEQLAWKQQSVTELQGQYDYATLTPSEQVSFDLWVYQANSA